MGSGPFLMLEYPISSNRYWRNFNGRTVMSAEAREYKAMAAFRWREAGFPLHAGQVLVELLLHPRMTKQGGASKSRMDLDNCLKVAIDALNGVAFVDDKQVRKLVAEVVDPVPGGGLSVRVSTC